MTDKMLGQKVVAAAKLKTAIALLQPGTYVRNELERRLEDLTIQIDIELHHRAEENKLPGDA